MKKISSIVIASLLVIVVFNSASVYADTSDATPFANGSGTHADPYQITTIEELDAIRDYLDNSFILINNLDFMEDESYADPDNKCDYITGDGWCPIGHYKEGTEFTGSFDGQQYAISNLFVNRSLSGHSSLFGDILDAEISHLGLIDVYVTGRGSLGSFAGHIERSSLSDCYATGYVGDVIGSGFYVGGLVGRNDGIISDCHASVDVTGDFSVGGLVGLNEGVISDSSASGDVIGSNFDNEIREIGGLVGANMGSIVDSFASGNVTGNTYVGGLAGGNWHNISYCHATGMVTHVWHNYGDITFGRRYIGRLNGADFGSTSDSYATGRVSVKLFVEGLFWHIINQLFPN